MKRILPIVLILAAVAVIAGVMMWNKPHQDMRSAEADLSAEAPALFAEFTADESAANEKYLNKIVAVTGEVMDFKKEGEGGSVMLSTGDPMFGVKCELDTRSKHRRLEFQNGEKVTFKGVCTGYLSDVVLVNCVEP